MNPSEPFGEHLLAQFEPDSGKLANYRKGVEAMLEKNERTLRRQKWYAGATWLFAVFLGTAFFVVGGERGGTPASTWMGLFACFLLIAAAVELVKYFINRSRVEVLKEVKGLELQILELKESLRRNV